jgi:hypothetical protein
MQEADADDTHHHTTTAAAIAAPGSARGVLPHRLEVLGDGIAVRARHWVMALALHPFVVGQAFRSKYLDQALEYVVNHPACG